MHLLLFETLALIGATVHTMEDGAAPLQDAVVLVEDGTITAVGSGLEIPEDAERVDLSGLHLVPGLVDGVVGFDAEHDVLYLDAGVTLVHDSGSPTGEMMMERTDGMRDRHPGPGLVVTGPAFAGARTQRPGAFVLFEPERALEQIDELMGLVDSTGEPLETFTLDRSLEAAQHAVAAGVAKERGMPVFGGLPVGMDVATAAGNGHTVVTGLDSFLAEGQRFEALPEDFDYAALAAEVKRSGVAVAPLLLGTARVLSGAASSELPAVVAALGPDFETAWNAEFEMFRFLAESEALPLVRRSLGAQRALVAALHAAGVPLVAGTGAANPGIAPGSGLVDELEQWGLAGLSPADALRAATIGTATAVGRGDAHGRIAPGFAADMAVLGADPTRSIDALRDPEVVVLRGRVLERFDLDELRAALVARQAQSRAERNAPLVLAPPPMPEGEILLDGTMDLMGYGARTAVERYQVVRLGEGRMAYGARVRIAATGKRNALEMLLVQVIQDNLVDQFEIILDELDENGTPKLGEGDTHGFHAVGKLTPETKKLSIERKRFGEFLPPHRTPETVAVVDGSSALFGLITAMHGRPGRGWFLEFDALLMKPIVDLFQASFTSEDGRIDVLDARGTRVWGFGPGGELLFGARAERNGRLDYRPRELPDGGKAALDVPEGRVFTGDPEDPFGTVQPAEAGSGK